MPITKDQGRLRRKLRVRGLGNKGSGRVFGFPDRPRLSVYRSDKHIYAQIIDDTAGHTLVSASSLTPELRGQRPNGGNVASAKVVGKLVAEAALSKGISRVCFDRNGYMYHGRIQALADAAREAGLKF